MFKLIKLCAYGLMAYFVYELVSGMTQEIEQAARDAGGQNQPRPGGNSGTRGNSPRASQGQRGMPVRVEDSSGAVSTRRTGRGVVHR